MVSSGEKVAFDLPIFKDNRELEAYYSSFDLHGGPFSAVVITTYWNRGSVFM